MKRPWSLMRQAAGCDEGRARVRLPAYRRGLAWVPSAFGSCWRVRPPGASLPSRSFRKQPNEAGC